MANENIFYPEPWPTQQRRFVPIPPPPDSPPPRSAALMVAVVLSCWPTGLEYQPQQRGPSAATIPAQQVAEQPPYKRQPESIGQSWEANSRADVWQAEFVPPEPTFDTAARDPPYLVYFPPDPQPHQRRLNAAIFGVVAAAEQPAFTRLPSSILAAWEPQADTQQRRNQITPLTLVYGNEPPRRSNAVLASIIDSWTPPHHYDWRRPPFIFGVQVNNPPPRSLAGLNSILQTNWIPAPPQPQRDPKNIVPLTLVYGNQPPRLKRQPLPIVEPDWPQQRRAVFTAGTVTTVQPPFVRQVIGQAWDAIEWPMQRRVLIAPLTLVYGDQPPLWAPGALRALIRETWEPLPDHVQRKELIVQPGVEPTFTMVLPWSNVLHLFTGQRLVLYVGQRLELETGERLELRNE